MPRHALDIAASSPIGGSQCPACGEGTALALPVPGRQAVPSDGRIVTQPSVKVACPGCGLVRHRQPLLPAEVAAIYATDYALPHRTGSAEDARGRAHAHVITAALGDVEVCQRILDAGCGSGAMLRARTAATCQPQCWGVDPALPAAVAEPRLTLQRGMLADVAEAWGRFAAIVSVNTIEHTVDPVAFLRDLAKSLEPAGRILVVCPAATPANNELLFYDHLRTISPMAMSCFVRQAELYLVENHVLDGELMEFQLFMLQREPGSVAAVRDVPSHGDVGAYLDAWRRLDRDWGAQLERWTGPVQAFGAGQMAALLRAYAPSTWRRVERLVVDRPAEAWALGPIAAYEAADHADGWITLVAVHPAARDLVAQRLRRDGGTVITWPDTIRH